EGRAVVGVPVRDLRGAPRARAGYRYGNRLSVRAVLIGNKSMQSLDPSDPPHTPDLFRLDGRVAIVTGAAGLLGEQHGQALAECGAHVVLADLNVGLCEQRARQLMAQNPVRALALEGDVTRKESWSALLEQVLAEFGRVDIL